MSLATKTLLLNAVPLVLVAGAYAVVSALVLPAVWRVRSRATATDAGLASVFPVIAAVAAIFAVLTAVQRRPLEGHLWTAFFTAVAALVPPVFFFARMARSGHATASEQIHAAEERTSRLEGSLAIVHELAKSLDAAATVEDVARRLIERAVSIADVELGALVEVGESAEEAVGIVLTTNGVDADWFPGTRVDLANQPSGAASAVFEGAPVSVYDAQASLLVNQQLLERTRAQSAVFVPLAAEGRVLAVLVLASLAQKRAFTTDELTALRSLANEAALALARVRSSSALAVALECERLIARITAKFRSELDIDSVLRVAVEETARALRASLAGIRLGEDGTDLPIATEWHRAGLEPVGALALQLPVSNLAVRERRTIALSDVENDASVADVSLGDRSLFPAIGSRAVLATPIVVFDELTGVFALHRPEAGAWTESDVVVAESVAREVGLALHVARLLAENRERLRQQDALLGAAQAVTAELELDRVLQRLVDEVAALMPADASDLFLYDESREVFRCAAVHGLPEDLVGFEFAQERGLAAEAVRRRGPVISGDYPSLAEPVGHAAYEEFTDAIVAPVVWGGDVRGVLGVGARGSATFTARDADVLDAFASLAALALRNAEIFEERTRQARIQQGFYRIAAVLGESLSLAETLDATAQAAAEALDGTFAAVLMPSPDRSLQLAGSYEVPQAMRDVLRGGVADESAFALCGREQRVIASPSLADDSRFDDAWRGLARTSNAAALLAVPLETPRGEGCGVVLIGFDEPRRFSDDDLELAQRLARAARGALERSELFEAERTARALAQELARTGTLLATELDPDAVLEEVVRRAPSLVAADACAIRIVDGDELTITAAGGEGLDELIGDRCSAAGWLSGDVFQSRRPIAVADAASTARHLEVDTVLAAGYTGYLGVPLVGPEGTAHGVLSLYSKRPRAWRAEETEAIAALAANTAAALSNAELYTAVALDRERNAAILDNVADGIVAVDRDGRVVLWNTAAERITGVPGSEAMGRTVAEVLQRDLQGEGEEGRLVSIGRGTEEAWLSVTEAVMRDPAGVVAGRIYAFRDISADRLVEEMKSEFVATVSHELRGPLTSIYGFAETLLRQDVNFGENERNTFLGYIASESERLTSIVDALLNVARLETGDLQVNIAPVEVRNVVSDVVADVEQSVDEHSFVLDLPPEPLSANADRDKLRQVLAVLIDNAVKFSPSGGTVTVSVRRNDDAVEVAVEDEGIGIPQSEHERIFRKFYRAGDAQHGTGVGLFIAQGLVGAMGGRIVVESEEGKGSLFTFALPAAPAPVVQEDRPRV